MTLRLRLFALLAVLAALLALGEWALVRKLSADLEGELATAAAAVGRDVLRVLRIDRAGAGGVPGEGGKVTRVERHVVSGPSGAESAEPQAPGARPPTLSSGEAHVVHEIVEPQEGALAPKISVDEEAAAIVARLQPHLPPEEVRLLLEGDKPSQVVLLHGRTERRLAVPTAGLEDAIGRFGRRLLFGSLALFGGAVLLAGVVVHRFTRPLRHLAAAARQIGEGELGLRAPPAPGEVGEAIAAFNQMSQRLAELDAETRRLRDSEQLSELGEVGRGLAHSLRNPLNALGLAIDHLADRSADPEAAEVAAAARRQIGRIDGALRGFLALAAGGAAPAAVDLVDVARDVALEALQARPPAGGTGVHVAVAVDAPEGPLRVLGVEAELRAALQALVVNAVEASPPGGHVEVALAADGDAVVITVDDAGTGLPEEVRSRLFTPHVTTKAAGAGVGLYLAHRVATTRYGGDLTLVDRPEGGTRARLTLRDRRGPATEKPR
jgi:signal transduction histidine kinase